MPLSIQNINDDSVFSASISNAKNVYHILKAVHFKDVATVFATENGLKITVEDSKSIQGNAFIQDQIFEEYVLREESVTFKIDLDILQQCLTIFGSSTAALRMCYDGYGTPLVLALEEDGAVTDCSIKTLEPDEILDFEFRGDNVTSKAIVVGECLKQALSELDTTTSDSLRLLMSPRKPHLRLSTSGECGRSHQDIPKDSDMVEVFECHARSSHEYGWNLLWPTLKAVNLANKVCIRIDHRGFLSLQCMIKNECGRVCFVEYYCCPNENVDESEQTFS